MSSSKNTSQPPHQLLVGFPAFPRKLSFSSTSGTKKVSLSDNIRIHDFHYIVENDDELSQTSWYDRGNYSDFRRSIKSDTRTLRRFLARNGNLSEELETNHHVTAVGIIHLASSKALACAMEHREAYKNAVLSEHLRQVQEGNMDPELLGCISSKISKSSKETAVALAQSM
ncbi:hypothetical protein ACHAXS_000781 [Conticribra weissflogii]